MLHRFEKFYKHAKKPKSKSREPRKTKTEDDKDKIEGAEVAEEGKEKEVTENVQQDGENAEPVKVTTESDEESEEPLPAHLIKKVPKKKPFVSRIKIEDQKSALGNRLSGLQDPHEINNPALKRKNQMRQKTLDMDLDTPIKDNTNWDAKDTIGWEVSRMIKGGLIDSDKLLDFDLDKYYNDILNKRSDLEEQNYVR